MGDRWVVVDPSYHFIMRLPDGHLATRTELKDPAIFQSRNAIDSQLSGGLHV